MLIQIPCDSLFTNCLGFCSFKKTDDGYEYVLVIVDIHQIILRKLKTKQMEEVAILIGGVSLILGFPNSSTCKIHCSCNQVLDSTETSNPLENKSSDVLFSFTKWSICGRV